MKRSKIVATVGPSSGTPETLAALIAAGVDVFRLNFSHGDHATKKEWIDMIRQEEAKAARNIAILGDLQGPKLRLGRFPKVVLQAGETLKLRLAPCTEPHAEPHTDHPDELPLPHEGLFALLAAGQKLILRDGLVRLEVTERLSETCVQARVQLGGELVAGSGVHAPGLLLPGPALTEKDQEDLAFALDQNLDWIALSFVQKPQDLLQARDRIGERAQLIAKIEQAHVVERGNLSRILSLADAVMVARGDLGVNIPLVQVPQVQKNIVRACRRRGLPVIVATEMLESMITKARPTRAEVSDVANAIYEGADAVMLSAETAMGAYPVRAVTVMRDIILETERNILHRTGWRAERASLVPHRGERDNDAMARAAVEIAEQLRCKVLVNFTITGSTSKRVAARRCQVPILSLPESDEQARRLALVWGVFSVKRGNIPKTFQAMVAYAIQFSSEMGFANPGDRIVVTLGLPPGTPGKTNLIRVCTIGEPVLDLA